MSGMMCAAIGMLQRKFSAMGKVRGWIRGDERERGYGNCRALLNRKDADGQRMGGRVGIDHDSIELADSRVFTPIFI